jgi:hypothetical protein
MGSLFVNKTIFNLIYVTFFVVDPLNLEAKTFVKIESISQFINIYYMQDI